MDPPTLSGDDPTLTSVPTYCHACVITTLQFSPSIIIIVKHGFKLHPCEHRAPIRIPTFSLPHPIADIVSPKKVEVHGVVRL